MRAAATGRRALDFWLFWVPNRVLVAFWRVDLHISATSFSKCTRKGMSATTSTSTRAVGGPSRRAQRCPRRRRSGAGSGRSRPARADEVPPAGGSSRPCVSTTSPASSPRTESRRARSAQPVLQDRRIGDPTVRRSERALALAVRRLSPTEAYCYKRLTSSATISAAGCARLTSATLCPAHIESASISPVVPTSGAAGE